MLRKRLQLLVAACFALVLLTAGCASQLPERPEELVYPPLEFLVPEVDQLVLPNGIRLYLEEDNELPLVQVTAIIGTGALATPSGKVGFDDLFAGTWRTGGTTAWTPDALEEHVDQLAANLGANMGPYFTQLDLSLRSRDLEDGMKILAELLRHPEFAEDRLELQRLQAQERVRRQNDDPGGIARRLLSAALYPDHYLGRSPTLESLAAVTRADLTAFHHAYFAPNNLWLAISGDFDRQELLDQLARALGGWAPREIPDPLIQAVNSPLQGSIEYVSRKIPQTTLLIGELGLTKDDPDQYAARVMNYILGGGGFNSRMMREIRSNRGLAYSAYSYFQVGRRLPGVFVAGTETKNISVGETLELIRAIMTDLRDNTVSPEELALAKESQVNSFVFGFDDAHAVVTQQLRLDFFDYPKGYLTDYRDRVAAVTAEDVQRVARKYIDFNRQQIVLVGDSEPYREQLGDLGLPVREVPLENGQ